MKSLSTTALELELLDSCAIQKFPHILENIRVNWGTDCLIGYIESLLFNPTVDDRVGRTGLPETIFFELSHLIDVHYKIYPQYVPERSVRANFKYDDLDPRNYRLERIQYPEPPVHPESKGSTGSVHSIKRKQVKKV